MNLTCSMRAVLVVTGSAFLSFRTYTCGTSAKKKNIQNMYLKTPSYEVVKLIWFYSPDIYLFCRSLCW